MMRKVNYFLQSIFIYLFFIISKIIGIKLSRSLFSFIFIKFGKYFKSQKIIDENLERISKKLDTKNQKKL